MTASDIIYDRLMRFKAEHDVPVVVQMMDVAASGGYYAALAGDEIVASPTTVTGSIGVLFTSVSVEGLLDKIGVRNQTVTSGAHEGHRLAAAHDDARRARRCCNRSSATCSSASSAWSASGGPNLTDEMKAR